MGMKIFTQNSLLSINLTILFYSNYYSLVSFALIFIVSLNLTNHKLICDFITELILVLLLVKLINIHKFCNRCVPGQHPRLRWSRSIREKRLTALYKLLRIRRALAGQNTQVMRKPQTTTSNKNENTGTGASRTRGSSGGTTAKEEVSATNEKNKTKEHTGEGSKRRKVKNKPPRGKHHGIMKLFVIFKVKLHCINIPLHI